MSNPGPQIMLPKGIDDVDAAFMTEVLRGSGAISATNEVMAQEEKGVGMTAGYFSAIKKVKCRYKETTDAPDSFVVKTWPPFELLPREAIRAMFVKDIKAYQFPATGFYPRPKTHLAAFDAPNDRFALVMEDAGTFAEHKVHEHELDLDGVVRMLPRLVDVAVTWEGCHEGAKAKQLSELGVDFWASDANIALYKYVMPGGARIFDKFSVLFVYYVGTGAAYWQGAALRNELPGRVELGGKGVTEADLAPEELRQRMWWRKALANFRENFKTFDQYRYLQSLPDNLEGLGAWVDLPDHLK